MYFNKRKIDFIKENSLSELSYYNKYVTYYSVGDKYDIEKKVGEQYDYLGIYKCVKKPNNNKIYFISERGEELIIDIFDIRKENYVTRERLFLQTKNYPLYFTNLQFQTENSIDKSYVALSSNGILRIV